jgi:hypothetical protein
MKHIAVLIAATLVAAATTSAAHASDLANRPLPRKGLVAYWTGEGHTCDNVGYSNGIAKGGVTFGADRRGKKGGAFVFDGKSGYITVPDRPQLDTDDAFTLSAWVKTATVRSKKSRMVLGKWQNTAIGAGDYFLSISPRGVPATYVLNGDVLPATMGALGGKSPLPAGSWTHLATTFDRGRLVLYINGRPHAEQNTKLTHTGRNEYAGDEVVIGGLGARGSLRFHGSIDDVGIWSRALSAEEIAQVFVAGPVVDQGPMPTIVPYVQRDTLSDRIVLTDGKVFKGVIANDAYELTTFFGKIKVPAKGVVALAPAGKKLWVMLADWQVLLGKPDRTDLSLDLPGGSVLKIPLARIRQCGYRITRSKPASTSPSGPMIILRSGQRLAPASAAVPALHLRTAYATVALPPTGLIGIRPARGASDGLHRAVLAVGSTLTGTLTLQTLDVKLALGPVATVRREEVFGLTGRGKGAAPTGDAVMTMRNGDRLVGLLAHKALTVRTEFGLVKVFPISVLTATFSATKAGAVVMTMWDGSTHEGQFVEPALTFLSAGGPAVKVAPTHVASVTRRYALSGPEVVKKVKKLIARLGAESYPDREAATEELVEMGKSIVPLLEKHRNNPDAEVRQRIEGILEQFDPKEAKPVPPPEIWSMERNGVLLD